MSTNRSVVPAALSLSCLFAAAPVYATPRSRPEPAREDSRAAIVRRWWREPTAKAFSLNQFDDFPSGNGITTVGGTVVATLDPGGAYGNAYTVHYIVPSVTINAHSTTFGSATLTVSIETNNGSGWVERAGFTYACSYTSSWPPPYPARTCSGSWNHEAQLVTVSGLGLNSSIRIKAKTFTVSNGAGGSFAIRGGDGAGSNPETYNGVTYQTSDGSPTVDAAPYNYSMQDYGRCAVSCFAVTYAQSTVPYISLDAPRQMTLVYNSDRANPRPFVHVNVSPDLQYGQMPTGYRFYLKVNGALVHFLNGEDTLRFAYAGTAPVRIGGQFDASSYTTGVYHLEIVVAAVFPSTVVTNVVQSKLTVVNESSAPTAHGWTIGAVQRLYLQTDSALITDGGGSAVFFPKVGTAFVSPPGEFSELVLNGSNGWIRVFADSTKVFFNTAGRMTEIRDRFNNSTTVVYDAQNRVSQIKDPLNQAITLTYDANGLDSITDAMGRVTQITVDASKRLTLIRDPDTVGTTFGYDVANRLSSITNRAGKTNTFVYDTAGKVSAAVSPSIQYIKVDESVVTGALVDSLRAWQRVGVPVGPTSPTPFSPPRADTIYARLMSPTIDTTRFTVTKWGQPVETRDPIGRITSVTYDSGGLPIRVIRSTGAIDSMSHNASGLPTYIRTAGTAAINMRYGAWALVDSVWGVGRPTQRRFISAGKMDSVRVAGIATTRFQYDPRGRLTRTTDPLGHLITKTKYYTTGQQNRHWDSIPNGQLTYFFYDSYGRVSAIYRNPAPRDSMVYDLVNRLRVTYDGINSLPTRYSYDSLYLRTVTDPKNQVYGFTYDAVGRMTLRTDPLGHSDRYLYDAAGSLRRWWNRRGDSTDYRYDRVGRLTKKFGPKTTSDSIWYASDDRSNAVIAQSLNPSRAETNYFDAAGRLDSTLTSINGQLYRWRYAYTAVGHIDSTWGSAPGGPLRTSRNYYNVARDVLDSVRFGTGVTRYHVLNDGVTDSVAFPNDLASTRTFTTTHDVQSIASPSGLQVFQWDPLRRMTADVSCASLQAGAFFRGYDGLGRLAADSSAYNINEGCYYDEINGFYPPARGPNWTVWNVRQFSYDPVGNRTDQSATYVPGSNRLSSFGNCAYTTDDDGNITSRYCGADSARFYWSSDNRLDSTWVSQMEPGWFGQWFRVTYTARHGYDIAGTLVRRNGYDLLWTGGNLAAKLDPSGAVVHEFSYVNGLDNVHAIGGSGPDLYAINGPDGSYRWSVDESGNPATYEYGPWGETGNGATNENDFGPGWKGALLVPEAKGLYYMRARWYEPFSGRFLSEDPIGLNGGINPYSFAGNDPINGRDPSGLEPCAFLPITGEWICPPVEVIASGGGVGIIAHLIAAAAVLYEQYFRSTLYDCSGTRENDPAICVDAMPWLYGSPEPPLVGMPLAVDLKACFNSAVQIADLAPVALIPRVGPALNLVLEVAAVAALESDIQHAQVSEQRKAMARAAGGLQIFTVASGSFPATAPATSLLEVGLLATSTAALTGSPDFIKAGMKACGFAK